MPVCRARDPVRKRQRRVEGKLVLADRDADERAGDAFSRRPGARPGGPVDAGGVVFQDDVALVDDEQAERDLGDMAAVIFAVESPVGSGLECFLVDVRGEHLVRKQIAFGPGKGQGIARRRRHRQDRQVVGVFEGLVRRHHDAAEAFPIRRAHGRVGTVSAATDHHGLPFFVDGNHRRRQDRHPVELQFLFVDQVQRPVRDKQPVADHQDLPSIVDHHLGRLMIVVGRRLLGVNSGWAEGQRE